MTGQSTSEVYWGDGSEGNQYWVTGQAFPPEMKEHYHLRRVLELCVDASAVFSAPRLSAEGVGGERWGISVKNPSEEDSDHFNVDIPADLAWEDRYGHLVEAVETQLGRTGLKILVY